MPQGHSLTYDCAAGTGVEWSQNAASASSRKEKNGIASLAIKYTRLCAVSGQFRRCIGEMLACVETEDKRDLAVEVRRSAWESVNFYPGVEFGGKCPHLGSHPPGSQQTIKYTAAQLLFSGNVAEH